MSGWPLFLTVCLLAATPYLYPPAGSTAVSLLFVGWVLVTLRVRTKPGRRRAQPAKGTGS